MSTEVDNKELIEAIWKSFIRHVQNKHTGHGQPFLKCLRRRLSTKNVRETVWFTHDSETCDALENIVLNNTLMKDIANSSAFGQTSPVGGYHSLVNQFALKMYHFSFLGMRSRLLLAAMHCNENAGRPRRTNKRGSLEFAIAFPKYKKEGYIVRTILTDCTYLTSCLTHLFLDYCLEMFLSLR